MAAIGNRSGENLEAGFGEGVGEIDDLHADPTLRLVAAEVIHGLLESQAGKGSRNIDTTSCFEYLCQHRLDQRIDIFSGNEAGLDIDLSEFRLTVSTQIFVAKTLGDLKVAFHAGHHQHLLVLLRRLRQCIKFSRIEAGRNQEIAGPFLSGVGKNGCFDFGETLAVQFITNRLGDVVAGAQVLSHARTAQVEVAVLHPQVLVAEFLVQLEWKDFSFVKNFQLGHDDFDLAGFDCIVEGAFAIDFRAHFHPTSQLDDVFAAQLVAELRCLCAFLLAKHTLCHSFAVADIDEDNTALITLGIDPANQSGSGSGV